MKGKIIKAMAGFYHVYSEEKVYLTKPRGLFRLENITPAVGDWVDFEADEIHMEGTITKIYPRQNILRRPRVSNVTMTLIVFSLKDPAPDYLLIDKLICNALAQGITPMLVFNKSDLDNEEIERAKTIYSLSPLALHFISAFSGEGVEELRASLSGGTHVVAGPSGTGKSSLLNAIGVEKELEVGEISAKLRRGRHTTRHVQLLPIGDETFIVDTPGFTNLALDQDIDPLMLRECYEEFLPFSEDCRYDNCLHGPEPQCGVKEALEQGRIRPERYENYLALLEEVKERKEYS
jgi:ribosome biogenesis GTPase